MISTMLHTKKSALKTIKVFLLPTTKVLPRTNKTLAPDAIRPMHDTAVAMLLATSILPAMIDRNAWLHGNSDATELLPVTAR